MCCKLILRVIPADCLQRLTDQERFIAELWEQSFKLEDRLDEYEPQWRGQPVKKEMELPTVDGCDIPEVNDKCAAKDLDSSSSDSDSDNDDSSTSEEESQSDDASYEFVMVKSTIDKNEVAVASN